MVLSLSGKYLRMIDLEKELGKPASSIYPLLPGLPGVIRVGYSFLVPESLLGEIRKSLDKKNSISLDTASKKIGCKKGEIVFFLNDGFPFIQAEGQERILKADLPALEEAIKKRKK